jgi:polysaccharide deacetylase family protein (PEP-CTERM system associated)
MDEEPSGPHLFSVDVEEYYHAHVFERVAPPASWDTLPSRVEASTETLLALLERHRTTATFFIVGCVAQHAPGLVRRIAGAGHEVASHSWSHPRVNRLSRAAFVEEARRSKSVLEDITGQVVNGFRAPSFSILPGTEWAFDVLLEEGYRYDSSLFPIRRPGYGYPGAAPGPHELRRPAGVLREFPMATLSWFGLRLPAAGGGWLRHFPLELTRSALRQHARAGEPAMVYTHPWEVDPEQPRLPLAPLDRWRHYGGLARTLPRLERLLSEFRFVSVERWLDGEGRGGGTRS